MSGLNPLLPEHRNYRYGRLLVLLSGVVMSVGSPIIRLLEDATAWQFLALRSLAICFIVSLMLLAVHRHRLLSVMRRAGIRSLVAGAFLAVTFTCIVFALLNTTIANALFLLLGTSPFLTAIGAWLYLGEKPSGVTLWAIAAALIGIFIMLGEGVLEGDLFGDLSAVGAAVAFAGYSVVIRSGRDSEMVPAVLWGGVFSGLVAVCAATLAGDGLTMSMWDTGVSLAYGAVGIGGGLVLYTLGSKFVPAAELNVLSLGEMVLAPLWVWLAFNEIPTGPTLAGGGVLLGAVLLQAGGGTSGQPAKIHADQGLWFGISTVLLGSMLILLAAARWLQFF